MSVKRNLTLFGVSVIAGLTGVFTRSSRKHTTQQSSLPLLYSGTWTYSDHDDHRIHRIQINPDLSLHIDNHIEPATVEQINSQELVYLDSFGYHLKIQANEQRPVALYDEADNATYVLVAAKPTSKQSQSKPTLADS